MDDATRKALKSFSDDLTAIVGEGLARSIINYAQRPSELEAVLFKDRRIRQLGGGNKECGHRPSRALPQQLERHLSL